MIDDGSTDNTKEVCENYSKSFDLTYIYQENSGVSNARNKGYKIANGEWIAFLDSDDRWHKDKLSKQMELAENSDFNLIHSDEIWIRNGVRVNQHKKHKKGGGDQFIPSLALCLISPSAVILKKSLLIEMGGFRDDFPVCEDYDLWLKVTSKYHVGYLEDPLIDKFGGHEDQLSQRYFAMDYYRVRSLYWIYKNRSLNSLQVEALLKVLRKKCQVLIRGYIKHDNRKNLKEIQAIFHEIDAVCQV